MPDERVCGCGCGAPLIGVRANAKYLGSRHRQRAYRKRVEAAAAAAGVPAHVSLQTVEATTHPQGRNGDAPSPPRAPRARPTDLRVSYRKLTAALDELRADPTIDPGTLGVALDTIDGLLTAKQRAALTRADL